ncbi:MAG: hypothetical protein LC656_02140 [Sphingomonadales bacterium]|nr:hypothetical protein [Sphingomonadales bacterium]
MFPMFAVTGRIGSLVTVTKLRPAKWPAVVGKRPVCARTCQNSATCGGVVLSSEVDGGVTFIAWSQAAANKAAPARRRRR